MIKTGLLLILSLSLLQFTFSQTIVTADGKSVSPEELQKLQAQIDSASLIKLVTDNACKCIDSISYANKNYKNISADIKNCIDKQVVAYEMTEGLLNSLKHPNDKTTININDDQNSEKYKECYNKIEVVLKDSCTSLKKIIQINDVHHDKSVSTNHASLEEYNAGVPYLEKGDYTSALPHFLTAVKIDPVFTFAWDNIGKCYRNLSDYDKAIDAYNKSLALDPNGETALQNIPIAYEFKKEYDKEIKAYQNFLAVYPDNPEIYYGLGNVYTFYKNDQEKGLDYMCKAYNIYTKLNSPYRVDAGKVIKAIYAQMKQAGKEDNFNKILKANNISTK
jgi:tetratricopeptide (TPR) repeat protein